MEKNPELRDKYNDRDPYRITDQDKKIQETYNSRLSNDEKSMILWQNHANLCKKWGN